MPLYAQALSDPEILGRPREIHYAPGPLDEKKVAFSVTSFYAIDTDNPVDGIGEVLPAGPKRLFFRGDETRYREGWEQALEMMWGITNRQEALQTVTSLLDRPTDELYGVIRPELQQLVNMPMEHRQAEAERLQDVVVRKYSSVREDVLREQFASWCKPFLYPESLETLPGMLPYHVVGWNTARAGWVLRLSRRVEFISDADLEPLMMRTLTVTRAWCADWREYVDSFLIGRAQWSQTPDDQWYDYRDRIAFCLAAQNMPWAHVPLHP